MTDLTVCRKTVVDIKVEAGIYTFKIEHDILCGERFGINYEATLVKTAGIVVRNVRCVYGKGIVDVGVVCGIIAATACQLPAHGNVDSVSPLFGIVRSSKIGKIVYRCKITKAPFAAKREETV